MNEVRTIQPVTQQVTRSTSSTGAEDAKTKTASSGKALPERTEAKEVKAVDDVKERAPSEPAEKVETAVAKVNDYVQSIQRDLHFSIDEDSKKTVVKVIDGSSGELIRQIPEEVFLELARKLNENGELQLMSTLG